MNEKGYWPWPGWMEGVKEVEFGPEELSSIRKLAVLWDIGETGAAGLADEDLVELDDSDDALMNLVEMFLNTAKVKNFDGVIRNPYRLGTHDPTVIEACLGPVPDQEIAGLLRSGAEIPLKAGPDDLALWRNASLRGTGIDPKRPFGSGNVSRDIRAIVDPDKTLNSRRFAAYRKTIESRQMLLLQFFVQNAELPFGAYATDDRSQWVSVDELGGARGEWIARDRWISNVAAAHHYQTEAFARTAQAAAHLLWENRLEGDYAALVRSLKLDNHYGVSESSWSRVPTLEIVERGLEAFPEDELEDEDKTLTLMLVRIYLSQSRFQDALDLLEKAKVGSAFEKPKNLTPYRPESLFYLEGFLARMGKEVLAQGVYASHRDSRARRSGPEYPWVTYLEETHECPPDEDQIYFWRAKANDAQFNLLRGPYLPY